MTGTKKNMQISGKNGSEDNLNSLYVQFIPVQNSTECVALREFHFKCHLNGLKKGDSVW